MSDNCDNWRMPNQPAELHVYARELPPHERSSLTVLAGLVRAGARVLDLGCGSGALGHHLSEHRNCQVDGVTFNPREAELARPFYRRMEVADLDTCALADLFQGQTYDYIVCADVLEHLKQPEGVLAACKSLLNEPQGELLISIPHVGYAGLVADLMQGEFRYRDEGLLDRTHLKFFTRQSLIDFLGEAGWGVLGLETIERPLAESEFSSRFDELPPSVARFLLSPPDALTYQFIARARPGASVSPANPIARQHHPQFTAQIYWASTEDYQEHCKITAFGEIGRARQTLRFSLPADLAATRLRLDPADRPGFLHWFATRLLSAQGQLLWDWQLDRDGLSPMQDAPSQQMLLRGPGLSTEGALVLLYGDDPWLELPVGAALQQAAGGRLEVDLGWPMSADYLALADSVRELELRQRQAGEWARATETVATLSQDVSRLQSHNLALKEQVNSLQGLKQQLQRELQSWRRAPSPAEPTPRAEETLPIPLPAYAQRPPTESVVPSPLPAAAITPTTEAPPRVDIIVPVYRGLFDTQRCLGSVLKSPQRQDWRLVVINDCSPEPEVSAWLRELARNEPRVTLLENEVNLGFVATVNRGMALSDAHDVVLLNSDTEVANDWLDRLVHAAHHNGRVGTVTPFSNNATICSYPVFCQANALPAGHSTQSLDALFAQANAAQVVDIPTGVGFCMYIRRDCLREIGLFDVESFGKGYGEENDFCRRAHAAGWRNLHALDTFVLHAGGVSFGASKSARELAAMETLRRLYPDYEGVVHEFIQRDPARAARVAVELQRCQAGDKISVLLVSHDRGGGTLRHTQELTEHMADQAIFHLLTPVGDDQVKLSVGYPAESLALWFRLPDQTAELHQALRSLNVAHVHFHHLLGQRPEVWQLPDALGLAFDFTAHDYYSMCPQISLTDASHHYCSELGLSQCHECLRQTPAPGNPTIELWHMYHGDMLARARYVLAPSKDTGRRLVRFAPHANVCFAPHTDLQHPHGLPVPAPRPRDAERPLRIVILGALSAIKGADLLEAVALAAAQAQVPLEFHLLGYGYRPLKTQPRAKLTVHGPYEEHDLKPLLDWLQPDVAWFTARWPETYSYTLSACLDAGLPIVAPALGAFTERLTGREWTWLLPWQTEAKDWMLFFDSIRIHHFNPLRAPRPADSGEGPQAQDAWIRDWHYASDYLNGVKPVHSGTVMEVSDLLKLTAPAAAQAKPVPDAPAEAEAAESPPAPAPEAAPVSDTVSSLQSLPGARWVARKVPGRVRRVLKRWLS